MLMNFFWNRRKQLAWLCFKVTKNPRRSTCKTLDKKVNKHNSPKFKTICFVFFDEQPTVIVQMMRTLPKKKDSIFLNHSDRDSECSFWALQYLATEDNDKEDYKDIMKLRPVSLFFSFFSMRFNIVFRAFSQVFFLHLKSYCQVEESAFGKTSSVLWHWVLGVNVYQRCTLSFKDMLMWTSVQKLDVILCHLSTSDASHDHIQSPLLIKVPSKQLVSP